ncbi:uncharacterized protein [Engystomops pustulosus]
MKSAGDTMVSGDLRRWQIHEGPGMGRARTLLLLLLFLCHTCAALEISAPSNHWASIGSAAGIPCKYTVEKPPVERRFLAVFWYFEGQEILSYDDELRRTDSRYSLNTEEVVTGIVDLSISSMSVSDAGVYTCEVLYSPEKVKKDITLHIHVFPAPPQVTVTGNIMDVGSVLRCSVTGFYPLDIDVSWLRGTQILKDVTMDGPRRNSDGTYSLDSIVTVTRTEDRERNFSCRVQHESLREPLQKDIRLTYTDKSETSKNESEYQKYVIAACIVAAILVLVIILAVYFIFKKRNAGHGEGSSSMEMEEKKNTDVNPGDLPVINAIMVPDLILNEEATMKCTIYNYRPEVYTAWWYEQSENTETLIDENDTRRRIELKRLDGCKYGFCLTLRPVTYKDDKIKYMCRVQGPEFMTQKTTGWLNVTGNLQSLKRSDQNPIITADKKALEEDRTDHSEEYSTSEEAKEQQQEEKKNKETSRSFLEQEIKISGEGSSSENAEALNEDESKEARITDGGGTESPQDNDHVETLLLNNRGKEETEVKAHCIIREGSESMRPDHELSEEGDDEAKPLKKHMCN